MSDQTTAIQMGPANAGRAPATRSRSLSERLARAGALLAAVLFALHGVAHAAGVAGIFGLGDTPAENLSTLVPGLDPASLTFRALGVLWMVALGLFVAAAVGIVLKRSWWLATAFAATVVSLVLCIVWFDAAIVGLVLNSVIVVGLVACTVLRRGLVR